MIFSLIQFPDISPFLLGPFMVGDFPLGLRWYSLAYIAGLIFGLWLAVRMVRSWASTVTGQDFDDLFIWFVVGVVVGGRLFFVLFYGLTTDPARFASPATWVQAWDGGMSFHGGMFGVAMAVIIYGWLKKNVDTLELGDYVAAVAPIGLLLGRFANFVNGELWGRQTDAPWAVLFPRAVIRDTGNFMPRNEAEVYPTFQRIIDSGVELVGRHPSQLYEALLEGVVLFIVLQVMIRNATIRAYRGVIAGTFIMGYGIFRWSVEWVREPDVALGFLTAFYPGATMGQLLSIPMILIGGGMIVWAWRKGPVKA